MSGKEAQHEVTKLLLLLPLYLTVALKAPGISCGSTDTHAVPAYYSCDSCGSCDSCDSCDSCASLDSCDRLENFGSFNSWTVVTVVVFLAVIAFVTV